MICIGKNITNSREDKLQPVTEMELYKLVSEPGEGLSSLIAMLNKTKLISKAQYDSMKKQLPYFCCSEFEQQIRNSVNFKSITHFTIDLDNVSSSAVELDAIKQRLFADSSVLMGFVSPGQTGLKLLFRLSEPLTNTKQFSDFYKAFAVRFGDKYGVQSFVDLKTSDVTRVSFLSADRSAYFNQRAVPVIHTDYIGGMTLFEELDARKKAEKQQQQQPVPGDTTPPNGGKENEEAESIQYKDILKRLNPDAVKPAKAPVIVPEMLSQIVEPIRQGAHALGIDVTEIIDINYGKKFLFQHHLHQAEVVVFYGRKGFTVVKSAKTGSNTTLLEVGFSLINQILYTDEPIVRNETEF